MPKSLLLMFFLVNTFFALQARNDNSPMGARSNGLGNANTTLSDEWSIFNNVAGLAVQDSAYSTSFYVGDVYQVPHFRVIGFAGSAPLRKGVAGIGFYRFGDAIYNEQKATLGYAHRIRNISLGIQTTYIQLAAENNPSRGRVLVEFGGIVDLTKKISFGAHIYNATQSRISEFMDERLSTVMKLGGQYRAGKKTTILGEVEKNVEVKETFKFGLEYELVKNVKVRTGLSTYAFNNSLGVGYQKNQFKFDYAFNWNEKFGAVNHISISILFKNVKSAPLNPQDDLIEP